MEIITVRGVLTTTIFISFPAITGMDGFTAKPG
jgi:hypothetical protein